jgi:hypothetical protein
LIWLTKLFLHRLIKQIGFLVSPVTLVLRNDALFFPSIWGQCYDLFWRLSPILREKKWQWFFSKPMLRNFLHKWLYVIRVKIANFQCNIFGEDISNMIQLVLGNRILDNLTFWLEGVAAAGYFG